MSYAQLLAGHFFSSISIVAEEIETICHYIWLVLFDLDDLGLDRCFFWVFGVSGW